MCLAHDAHNDRALLHGLLRVLDLEDAALGRAAGPSDGLLESKLFAAHLQRHRIVVVVVSEHDGGWLWAGAGGFGWGQRECGRQEQERGLSM